MSGIIQAAATDQYATVKVWTTADGAPKTDITFATSGLAIKYQSGNGSIGSLTPVSMTAGGAHADGGLYHRGNGTYKIGLTDALVASAGELSVWIELTDCDSSTDDIRVVAYDPDATDIGALSTALTESYAADGSAATAAQLLYLIAQHLNESSISGTTKTVKKLDGSTTAATFTLDDATTPTSITRAS